MLLMTHTQMLLGAFNEFSNCFLFHLVDDLSLAVISVDIAFVV